MIPCSVMETECMYYERYTHSCTHKDHNSKKHKKTICPYKNKEKCPYSN